MPRLLGDIIHDGLSHLHVSSQEVEEWLGRPCGCKERQEKLNALDRWARRSVGEALEQSARWLAQLMDG